MSALIRNVKNVVLVSSAKGGVGKSTTAVNLAFASAASGRKTAILDLDIYGPSIPKMTNSDNEVAEPLSSSRVIYKPVLSYGLELMSIGYLVPRSKSVSWKGLMVSKFVNQLLFGVEWSETDILFIDLPPGTSDVAISVSQMIKTRGAVVVTTPQDVAINDVERGIDLFNKVNVEVLGFVVNMAYISCKCGEKIEIFKQGKRYKEVVSGKELGIVPLIPQISQDCEKGIPGNNEIYRNICDTLFKKLKI